MRRTTRPAFSWPPPRLQARLHAERRGWWKANVSSRRAFDYLQKSRPAGGGLSSEFELGFGLFDYYAV
jgi:hypothetical protein